MAGEHSRWSGLPHPQFPSVPHTVTAATFMAASQRRTSLDFMELDEILKPDDSERPPPADWDDALEM